MIPGGARAWWIAACPLLFGIGISVLAGRFPERIEALYSRRIYPSIGAQVHGAARRWAELTADGELERGWPSLSEMLLFVGGGALAVALWRAFRRGTGALVRRVMTLSGVGYLGFTLAWGLNHARLPLAHTLEVAVEPVDVASLNHLALELERDLRLELDGHPFPTSPKNIRQRAARSWEERLLEEPDLGWQPRAIVRAPLLSPVIAAAGITGIFSPFSQEAHVAAGMPTLDLLFTACHEIAHVQGWAREDEANYLAWRICSRASDRDFRVAGLCIALVHVHRALRRSAPELQRERVMELDVRIVALLEEREAFWSRTRKQSVSRTARAINDAYLKSQGHEGVASYGRMVDLLVAEMR